MVTLVKWINGKGKFRYFLFFLTQERTSNYNLVDECILLFRKEGCKDVATWHQRKN